MTKMIRFCILFLSLVFTSLAFAETTTIEKGVAWYDVSQWNVEGRGWKDTMTPFTRFPARAKETVPGGVWGLSQQSAGLFVRFKTDATTIRARHEVGSYMAMPHMTAIGCSGLDLYARDDKGAWRWAGSFKPNSPKDEQPLLENAAKGSREFMLYLPLYNTTKSLSIGVPEGSVLEVLPASDTKPIVYYGTSIAQGCSASRPGMTIPSILGRRLDFPVINLGFSGCGRMEPALCDLIKEIEASVYVLDCVPNMSTSQIDERVVPFVRELRKARPETPIILVEGRPFTNSWLIPGRMNEHRQTQKSYRQAYDTLVEEGITDLSCIAGDMLFGDDDEGAIDGSHPTDLGMVRQADCLEPVLRKMLKKE